MEFDVLIEIPRGSRNKYEVDHQDRVTTRHPARGNAGEQEEKGRPYRYASRCGEDFVMVRIGHRPDEAKGSLGIGRRVGGEIETVGVAPVPEDQRTQKPWQTGALLGDAVLTRLSQGDPVEDPGGLPPVVATTVVSGSLLRRLAQVAVDAVAGFPSGAHLAVVKAAEAAAAVAAGASEVDMVIDLGAACEDRWTPVIAEVAAVRAAVGPRVVLKVIIETAVIGLARIEPACRAAESGGADFVKTSTGFHRAGGATLQAVRAIAAVVGGRLGAGVICHAKPGERVVTGQPIVELRGDDPARLEAALAELAGAIEIGDDPPPDRPLVLERIGF